jgi:hypothetical protein
MATADVRATWHGSKVVLVPRSLLGSIFLESDQLVVCRSDFAFLRVRAAELGVIIDVDYADALERLFSLPFRLDQP